MTLNANSYSKKQTDNKTIVYINPKQFWTWLLQTPNYTYQDLIVVCCKLGTSYNCYRTNYQIETIEEIRSLFNKPTTFNLYQKTIDSVKSELNNIFKHFSQKSKHFNEKHIFGLIQLLSAMELYKQIDYIENEFHYINSERMMDKNKIQIRYLDIFSQLLFTNENVLLDPIE